MFYRESDDNQFLRVAFPFDYHSVEAIMGFDRDTTMQYIAEYEDDLNHLGMDGYFDILDIVGHAIQGRIINGYGTYRRDSSTDYVSEFHSVVGNEISDGGYDGVDEDDVYDNANTAAAISVRLHHIFLFGFSAYLSHEQASFISDALPFQQDIPEGMERDLIIINDSEIMLPALIPIRLDEYEYEDNSYYRYIYDRFIRKLPNPVSGVGAVQRCIDYFSRSNIQPCHH